MTNCASLVTAPTHDDDPFDHIEFVRLSDGRVLAVMVNSYGDVENRLITVPDFIDVADLNKASKDIKRLLAGGQTIDSMRENLIAELTAQKGRVNEMIDQMMLAAHQWGQPVIKDGAMVVAGSTNLVQYPELVREKLQSLIKMFEEKRLLMGLMDEVKKGPGVQIFIGKDNPLSPNLKDLDMSDLAVVASSYGPSKTGKTTLGTLGVIGPVRMNYRHTVGLVNFTSQLLGAMLENRKADSN